MTKRIAIIDGQPDADTSRYGHALADAYAAGAAEGGHAVQRIALAALDIPLLRSATEWKTGSPPPAIIECQETIAWADHLVIIYPLWLGTMPAVLKAFFEQVFRPGFAIEPKMNSLRPGLLKGRSARVVVTMGMPAVAYRWFYRAHSLKSLERNILRFCGIAPVAKSLIGGVEAMGDAKRGQWLAALHKLGRAGR